MYINRTNYSIIFYTWLPLAKKATNSSTRYRRVRPIALLSSAKAWALINNRDCLIPEDVQAILPAVAEHRLRSALGDFSTHGSLGWIMKTLQRYWNKWLNKRINAAIQHHLNHQKIFILPAKLLYFFVFVFTTYFAWY
jgi:hypothetical protein